MTPTLFDINSAEQAYPGPDGSPVLGQAFDTLTARWAAGERDRETALRLLFLGWYANCEPEVGSVLAGRAVELQPTAPLSIFEERGAYGEYFSHMLSARAAS